MMRLRLRPVSLREANALVLSLHRHHGTVVGHKFSIGVEFDGQLVGAVIVGRPVSRHVDNGWTAEVTRLVSDGTPHVCSMLYAAAARAAKAMGYRRIQTYILESEPGISLRAAGWSRDGQTRAESWSRASRPRLDPVAIARKSRWAKSLSPEKSAI